MGHWLTLCAPNARVLGSIPGQGTRSHMQQLRVLMPQLKTPHAVTKTWHSQINKYLKRKKEICCKKSHKTGGERPGGEAIRKVPAEIPLERSSDLSGISINHMEQKSHPAQPDHPTKP